MIEFDEKTGAALYAALKASFPDAKVGTADLAALAACLLAEKESKGSALPPGLAGLDLDAYREALAPLTEHVSEEPRLRARASDDPTLYYWIEATHTRLTPSGFEPFVGKLAMARVSLPERVPRAFSTAIGDVLPGDHLLDTVLEANQKYASVLGYEIERLDCITPTREGVRFGAVSLMLGFRRATDPLPSCYVLEAGTATGQPKVLFLGETLETTIDAYSGYQPTPFACPNHAYLGRLTMEGPHPKTVSISSRKVKDGSSQPPYIRVDVDFRLQEGDVSSIWPGFLIARAATIVLLRELGGRIPQDCAPDAVPPSGGEG